MVKFIKTVKYLNLNKNNFQILYINLKESKEILEKVQKVSINNENIFEVLMEASKICSLGEISAALFEVGGQYRRNM